MIRDARTFGLALLLIVGISWSDDGVQARDIQTAILAAGCFWCAQSDFESVPGVTSVVAGYTGGTLPNPTYRQVSRGNSGYYESILVKFDADRIGYRHLLDLFFRSVDPTDAGGQFCDRGPTYRTAIFVRDGRQRKIALAAKTAAAAALGQKIVTKILPASRFYKAAPYHQDYYKGHRLVFTRFGLLRQNVAYRRYRKACGRDQRVRTLWGDAAPFAFRH